MADDSDRSKADTSKLHDTGEMIALPANLDACHRALAIVHEQRTKYKVERDAAIRALETLQRDALALRLDYELRLEPMDAAVKLLDGMLVPRGETFDRRVLELCERCRRAERQNHADADTIALLRA